jgi:hypothetical protein
MIAAIAEVFAGPTAFIDQAKVWALAFVMVLVLVPCLLVLLAEELNRPRGER